MHNLENASSLTYEEVTTLNSIVGAYIHINGVVQGVGFRPFIYQLAQRYSLTGWVRNTSAGVDIDINASLDTIKLFVESIKNEAPPLARIDEISVFYHQAEKFHTFEIKESQDLLEGFQPISADVSICEDCLRELFDPKDRRYRYPFINCTNCGPRFTIIKGIPYDRHATTMAEFEMCAACFAEYTDPLNRRFHAQPIACPDCGPQVWFENSEGEIISKKDEAIKLAREWIKEGKILAIKGLGGFHLTCDATNQDAVTLLRRRKLRIDKPFAVMAYSLNQIEQFCSFDEQEQQLLLSRERPIVLLKRKSHSKIVQEIAPHQNTIGVMLPYTPLHYLLLEPQADFPYALVMTSGNLSEEPIAIHNQQAKQQLHHLADGFLLHNREIYTRCDDSVVQVWRDKKYFIRRSRGYAPLSITLPFSVKEILAGGGELKNTFCLTKGNQAFQSQHIGNLENYETFQAFEEAIYSFEQLFRITPQMLAHDKHPDYLATRYILDRAAKEGLPTVGVQHHHAHIASCMADNMIPEREPVIGVAMDGTGYGDDGTIWGGEFLITTYQQYQRAYHLATIRLPGGEAAIIQPWRTAVAWLRKAGIVWDESIPPYSILLKEPEGERQLQVIHKLLEREVNSPKTSSMGRAFDAVASLLNIRQVVNYEAQAAVELENIAKKADGVKQRIYPFMIEKDEIDISPILRAVIEDFSKGIANENIAYNFHYSIAMMVTKVCEQLRSEWGISRVVLSGGVWQNMLLLEMSCKLLEQSEFDVFYHHQVPTNDGGIALGQAVVASCYS